jgi:hypothetical protein
VHSCQFATGTVFAEEIAELSTVDAEQMADIRMVASADTLRLITSAAAGDDEYNKLIQQIMRSWPEDADEMPSILRSLTN